MNTTYLPKYKNESVQLQYYYDIPITGDDAPAGIPNYTPGVDGNTDQDVINTFEEIGGALKEAFVNSGDEPDIPVESFTAEELQKGGEFLDDVGERLEETVDKLEEVVEVVGETIKSEAEALWNDIKNMFGANRGALEAKWRKALKEEHALKVDGTLYTTIEPDVRVPNSGNPGNLLSAGGGTPSYTTTQVNLELTRLTPLINLLNKMFKSMHENGDENYTSGDYERTEPLQLPVPSLGHKEISTWKLSCPPGHILLPKLDGEHVRNPKGYYEETDVNELELGNNVKKFYNISNECGISYKENDEVGSAIGKIASGLAEGIKTGADFLGLTEMVFSSGTKQCCRQHRMCMLGHSDAMESVWTSGAQEIDGGVCEQEYWECLGGCALMGSLQKDIAGLFEGLTGADLSAIAGTCPSESDITYGGGGAKVWSDTVGKIIQARGAARGRSQARNAALKKIYGPTIFDKAGKIKIDFRKKGFDKFSQKKDGLFAQLKNYNKAKKAGKSTKNFSKKTINMAKRAKFVKKAMSTGPKILKEIAIAPILAFSSFDTSYRLPVHENWMCVPQDSPTQSTRLTQEEYPITQSNCLKMAKNQFGDKVKGSLQVVNSLKVPGGCSVNTTNHTAHYNTRTGVNDDGTYTSVTGIPPNETQEFYRKSQNAPDLSMSEDACREYTGVKPLLPVRFVRITSDDWMNFSQVTVKDKNGTNLSKNKPCSSDGSYKGQAPCSNTLDGVQGLRNWDKGFHSKTKNKSYWQVDLKDDDESYNNLSTSKASAESAKYRGIGPYRDTIDRAFRYGPKQYGHNKETCSEACENYNYFALQDNGWCSCENDFTHATKYGEYDGEASCGEMGGGWCNYIYQNNISTMSHEYKGCYRDCSNAEGQSGNRDLPSHQGNLTLEECKAKAVQNNKKYFGLQYHNGISGGNKSTTKSECWIGDNGETTNISVGGSSTNSKTLTLPQENMSVSTKPINQQDPLWRDTFKTSVQGNKLTVTRTDYNGGWGQNLVLTGTFQGFGKQGTRDNCYAVDDGTVVGAGCSNAVYEVVPSSKMKLVPSMESVTIHNRKEWWKECCKDRLKQATMELFDIENNFIGSKKLSDANVQTHKLSDFDLSPVYDKNNEMRVINDNRFVQGCSIDNNNIVYFNKNESGKNCGTMGRECIQVGYLPIDCEGSWSGWSSCSAVGSQSRSYTVTKQPQYGGNPCPSSQTRICQYIPPAPISVDPSPSPAPSVSPAPSPQDYNIDVGSIDAGGGGGDGVPCLGSENVLLTDRGTVKLKDLKVGDRVITRDGKLSIVFYIRNHGFTPVPHLCLRFSDGATVILTTEHLLYDETNNLVRADAVSVGDVVFGGEIIVKIESVMDIPLTPCVVEGAIDIEGKSISCWSRNAENAKKMEALCGQVQDAMDQSIPIAVIAKMAHDVYEKYHASGKDLSIMHAEATRQKDQYFSNTEVSENYLQSHPEN